MPKDLQKSKIFSNFATHFSKPRKQTGEVTLSYYNATHLTSMGTDCVIINTNGQYNRSMGGNAIYQATKGCWRMNANRIKNVKYVLSEYRGLIVEVFEVERWYTMPRQYVSGKNKGKTYNGWCFDGHVAPDVIRDLYINKSIAHTKTKGQANPITYSLP